MVSRRFVRVLSGFLLASTCLVSAMDVKEVGMDKLGEPVDIASSAYDYRADRRPKENAPESWLLLMRYAGQPLNEPPDMGALAIRQALCGLLWEEIRPVQQVELSWAVTARRRPSPEELVITTLDNQGTASSWWNNLAAGQKVIQPTVSEDGQTYVYDLHTATCGIVVSITGAKNASDYDVPAVRALVAETWKKMDIEIEWGFDETTANKDYSGRLETYDGIPGGLRPLKGDPVTVATGASSWRSDGKAPARRGIELSLLYMGESKWRKVQSFTTQPDDVARTIVTVWTQAGAFSFLAADLDNGPILAPEYGFFVRRTDTATGQEADSASAPPPDVTHLTNKMDSIAGSKDLQGWGTDLCPWFGGNSSEGPVSVSGITVSARSLAMHPGADEDVAVGWKSPIKGTVRITAGLSHGQAGGDGVEWRLVHQTKTGRGEMARG